MDSATLEIFFQALKDLQSELEELELISKDAGKPVILDQSMVGRLSRMDAMQGAEMAQEASRRRKLQLARIPAALARIDTGDFGLCVDCDEEIVLGRLRIDPTYTLCVRCANKAI
jgi:DnaK suppressor protein